MEGGVLVLRTDRKYSTGYSEFSANQAAGNDFDGSRPSPIDLVVPGEAIRLLLTDPHRWFNHIPCHFVVVSDMNMLSSPTLPADERSHLKEEYYDKYNGCLWPCVAIWCLDRLVRLGRIVYQSVIPRCAKGVKAVATFDKRSEMIRLDITDFFHKSQVVPPVQFYYVYTPGALKGYESHPFTLCSWNRLGPSLSSSPQGSLDIDPEKQITSMFQPVEETILSDQLSHSFLIRPYGGFTERLRDKINASHEKAGSSEITVFIEGPYGNTMDLSHYSDVLIIAGGSGITAAVSHAYHLLATGNTTIRLAWAVPQRHLVDNVCENELAAIVRNRRFYLDVYLTSGAAEDPEKPAGIPPYAVHFGRPDIYAVMRDARQKCTSDLAVVTCGTPAMADVCRAGVVRLLGENGANVAYFNETMLW